MTAYNNCRFCKDWRGDKVKYGVRHYAHFKCYLDAGKSLDALHGWQVSQFPYFLLKDRGLLDQAKALAGNDNPISGSTSADYSTKHDQFMAKVHS